MSRIVVLTIALLLWACAADLCDAGGTTHTYTVRVKTSPSKSGAGTDANVFVTLYGDLGTLSNQRLDKSGYNDFESGDDDRYKVSTKQDLGEILAVKLKQDQSGAGDAWYCDWVKIYHPDGHSRYFKLFRWLASNEGDHKCYCTVGNMPHFTVVDQPHQWTERVKSTTYEYWSAGTSHTYSSQATTLNTTTVTHTNSTTRTSSASIGGGASGLSASLGMDETIAKSIIDNVSHQVSEVPSLEESDPRETTVDPGANQVICAIVEDVEYYAPGSFTYGMQHYTWESLKLSESRVTKVPFTAGSPELAEYQRRHPAARH